MLGGVGGVGEHGSVAGANLPAPSGYSSSTPWLEAEWQTILAKHGRIREKA